ncbi:MAG TPA: hypothetical protein VH062_15705 [Polyangiaceae bacterium]|nr:hypothetical protein [Polyangiaceae bacterium]
MNLRERICVFGSFALLSACSSSGDDNQAGVETGGVGASGVPNVAAGGSGGTGTAPGGVTGAGGVTAQGAGGALGAGGSVIVGTGGAVGSGGANGGGGSPGGGSGNGGSGTAGNGGVAASGGAAGSSGAAGAGGGTAAGSCCSDGMCLCHGDAPTALTSAKGPYTTKSYTVAGAGCIFYPTNADAPFAAVTVSDGFGGAGGCNSAQTGQWGPLYASWGIVAMIIDTGASDQPNVRGQKLTAGIAAFKSENMKMGSPLMGKLSGRYGTSGFSMGGGGTTYTAAADSTLLTNVAIMAWGPVTTGIKVPSLFICGSSDTLAGCGTMGTPAYDGIPDTVPKMRVTINSGHAGQPSSGGGKSGQYGLAFQKVFLENDQRWRPLLVGVMSDATNIK